MQMCAVDVASPNDFGVFSEQARMVGLKPTVLTTLSEFHSTSATLRLIESSVEKVSLLRKAEHGVCVFVFVLFLSSGENG